MRTFFVVGEDKTLTRTLSQRERESEAEEATFSDFEGTLDDLRHLVETGVLTID
jgi:hypothetical protein